MPEVGFEHTIPVLERAKTIHALDRAATVIGKCTLYEHLIKSKCLSASACPIYLTGRLAMNLNNMATATANAKCSIEFNYNLF
jgi:hypothetical protein